MRSYVLDFMIPNINKWKIVDINKEAGKFYVMKQSLNLKVRK